ncbi:ABC transporter permease [Bacillus sp. F19]|nr:ABC transporter permease [Bacillus sp. F19]
MIGLIQNEWMKIFSKVSSWIYLILIVMIVSSAAFIDYKFTEKPSEDWRQDVQAEITQLQQEMKELPEEEREWQQMQISEKQLYLQEDINPNAKSTWHFLNNIVFMITSVVTLFAVIVCSANVASEFSDGTIKQLLIRPHRRWKVLLSKYIAATLYSLLLLLVLLTAGYLAGLIMFGAGDYSERMFEISMDGQMNPENIVAVGDQAVLKLLYFLPSLFIVTAIAFMLSTLFKSQALAVGIGIFVLFFSSTIGGVILFVAKKYTWTKFLIFPHMDLTVYAYQDKILDTITLPISLLILAIYYAVFMTVTFVYFQKRDISI